MIYKNPDIPDTYNKIAEISDNFIVWVKETKLNNNTNYDAYIQYMTPSFCYFFTDNYKIKLGTEYSYDVNYMNNGMYSYIDSYDASFSLSTLVPDADDITDNDFDRADFPTIFVCQFIVVLMFLWTFKQLSRLFVKGGLW